ncbi:hypothetical protein [Hyphomicrobium sp.]|nr:hypothetical protein [Hyphomicrobium sp.]
MALIALIILVGGAFAIAAYASGRHFGQPRDKTKRKKDSDPDA